MDVSILAICQISLFRCAMANNLFETSMESISKNEDKTNKCECGVSFKRKSHLKHHISSVHSKSKIKVQCDFCKKNFHPLALSRHVKLSCKQKCENVCNEFVCDVCGRVFKRKDHLKTHTESLHEKKKIKCRFCSKMLHPLSYSRHIKQACHPIGISKFHILHFNSNCNFR